MRTHSKILQALAVCAALVSLTGAAATFTANFNDLQIPPGASVEGVAVVENGVIAGVTNGVVKLTTNVNSQLGGFIIDDLDGGAPVNGFDLKLKIRVGGGTEPPADGYSFSWGSSVSGAFSEEGTGDGLTVAFDTYDNGGGEAPAVDIKWGGATLVSTRVPISRIRTGGQYWDLNIRLDPDGSLDVMVRTNQIYKDYVIAGFTAVSSPRYGFGARTGGLNDHHWIDDISLTTTTGPVTLAFARPPTDVAVLEGRPATFRMVVNDSTSVTSIQWQRKPPGSANFIDIPGATADSFKTAPTSSAETGTQFRVLVRGQNNSATSEPATLTVLAIPVPSPTARFDFNNGQTPANTTLLGQAQITTDGGVGNTGVLRLTEAINDQRGAFVIADFNNGKTVEAFVATFRVRIGGGTVPPADGFSFSWSPTAPTIAPAGAEDGFGGGLRLGFDIYNNGGNEAPAIELRQGSRIIASKKPPIEQIESGDDFADVLVRLERDATVDVAYNGELIFLNVPFANWAPLTGGHFIFAARTGGLNENHFVDDIAITTVLQAANPTLTLSREAGDLVLAFTGVIQSADKVEGPYADVTGAANPLRIKPDGPAKFFRARAP